MEAIQYGTGSCTMRYQRDNVRFGKDSVMVKDQSFGTALRVSDDPFLFVAMDGIVGLGFSEDAQPMTQSLIENVNKQKLLEHNLFTFFYRKGSPNRGSESVEVDAGVLTIGAVGPLEHIRKTDHPVFVPLSSLDYWEIRLESITVEDANSKEKTYVTQCRTPPDLTAASSSHHQHHGVGREYQGSDTTTKRNHSDHHHHSMPNEALYRSIQGNPSGDVVWLTERNDGNGKEPLDLDIQPGNETDSNMNPKHERRRSKRPPSDICKAAVDTGSSLIGLPTDPLQFLSNRLGITEFPQRCASLKPRLESMTVHFNFYDSLDRLVSFPLKMEDYLLEIDANEIISNNDNSFHSSGYNDTFCRLALMELNIPEPRGPLVVLGNNFIQRYMTIFDRDNLHLGFIQSMD
eukprot:GHVH01008038.1.p1 GENE.GHVH01008038.1~~GHVH01008038.1.p1  ORF type:complete len:403 (-),score=56.86 GHVH01008038.1:80-1288(-)